MSQLDHIYQIEELERIVGELKINLVDMTKILSSERDDLDSYSYAYDQLETAIQDAIDEYDRAKVLFCSEGAISKRRVEAIIKQLREVIK